MYASSYRLALDILPRYDAVFLSLTFLFCWHRLDLDWWIAGAHSLMLGFEMPLQKDDVMLISMHRDVMMTVKMTQPVTAEIIASTADDDASSSLVVST